MAMYKYCGCGKKIDYYLKRCEDCDAKYSKVTKDKYKDYKSRRTDVKEQEFYNSKEWKAKRKYILNKYMYIDIYAYYTLGEITQANTVHHVKEVKKDWNNRLNSFNLICVSEESHLEIHNRIKKENENKIADELFMMLDKFRAEFGVVIE